MLQLSRYEADVTEDEVYEFRNQYKSLREMIDASLSRIEGFQKKLGIKNPIIVGTMYIYNRFKYDPNIYKYFLRLLKGLS